MAHEILSAKLCEMDQTIMKIHSRIREGEHLSTERLQEEIRLLQEETEEAERYVCESLKASRAEISSELRRDLLDLKDRYGEFLSRLGKEIGNCEDLENRSERRLLFAEYGIDFALLAVNHSLILALEAICAERENDKEDREL